MGNRRRRLGPSDTHPQQAAVKSFGKLACKTTPTSDLTLLRRCHRGPYQVQRREEPADPPAFPVLSGGSNTPLHQIMSLSLSLSQT